LGARTLNQSVETSIDRISEGNVQVLWQTGKIYFEDCQRLAEGNKNLKVYQFIDRMDLAYDAADIVISRAGALSIAELQLVGKPVILVPSPNVAEDHQTHNAMALVNKHAALMVKDDEARLNLIGLAYDLLANQKLQDELSKNIKAMAIADASDRIVDEIFKICAL
jgi:UDP-N-acetylglucosamine--N-acetylmuramyl-(pentapeptide) pyrophosphoryl-undecaprenol N-acetylglucosamine transferase